VHPLYSSTAGLPSHSHSWTPMCSLFVGQLTQLAASHIFLALGLPDTTYIVLHGNVYMYPAQTSAKLFLHAMLQYVNYCSCISSAESVPYYNLGAQCSDISAIT
jgi:hypothetical protein